MGKSKDIKEAVQAELVFDPLVDDSGIEVQNLEGDVRLNGIVPSYSQYLEAADAARRVAGVKRVHNHLEVVLPDWAVRDDATLSDIANNALLWDVTVPVGVEASVKDGNITLTGTVAYGSQRIAAEGAVAGLTGVRGIKNRIEISPDADPVDVEILVSDALDRYALFDDSDVTVLIDGSTVTLGGHVRTWAEHDAVVLAAWMANGVFEVKDDLLITGRAPPVPVRSSIQRTHEETAVKASNIARDVAVAKGLRHAWTWFQERDDHDESQHHPEHVVRGALAMKVALLGVVGCGAVLAPAVLRHRAAKRWHR